MKTLSVTNFSCIENAQLEIGNVTLIIGPQASGKSVLCKLCYFLIDCTNLQHSTILKEESFEKFSSDVREKFIEWFPISAWGCKKFNINFEAGNYSIILSRKTYKSNNISLHFSDAFKKHYENLLSHAKKMSQKVSSTDVDCTFRFDWELRETIEKSLNQLMGKDYIRNQVFVPAGRSFFTSIGKAIAAFEQGRVLNPLILRFGHIYTSYKDRQRYFFGEKNTDTKKSIEKRFNDLLGGKVEQDGEKEYVHMEDGRKIPLSALSSGQQELLPLVVFSPWIYGRGLGRLCYIEEPEAHLFPLAQSHLIEGLIIASYASTPSTNLIMTTHSPYVLTKINNLLKAGSAAKKFNDVKKKKLEAIVNKRAWLLAKDVRAYAIKDGNLFSILEEDGLINADYLDTASGNLSEEFDSILDLEVSDD